MLEADQKYFLREVLHKDTIKKLEKLLKADGLAVPDNFAEVVNGFCGMAIDRARNIPEFEVENQPVLRKFIKAYKALSESDQESVAHSVYLLFELPWAMAVQRGCSPKKAAAVGDDVKVFLPLGSFQGETKNLTSAHKLLISFESLAQYKNEDRAATPSNSTHGRRYLFLSAYAMFMQVLHKPPTPGENGLFCSFMKNLLEDPALIKCGLRTTDVREQTRIARDRYLDPEKLTGGANPAS